MRGNAKGIFKGEDVKKEVRTYVTASFDSSFRECVGAECQDEAGGRPRIESALACRWRQTPESCVSCEL